MLKSSETRRNLYTHTHTSKLLKSFATHGVAYCVLLLSPIFISSQIPATAHAEGVSTSKVYTTEPWVRGGLATKISLVEKGAAEGVATLDTDSKIPIEQIPTLSYLPLGGGTVTGAVAMGGNKITGLGTPTDAADAVTKGYTDSLVHFTSTSGSVPSWAALQAQSWDTPHWGDTWSVDNGSNKVQGVGTCLSVGGTKKSENVWNPPTATTYGMNCWCRVESINDTRVLGAWVFYGLFTSNAECYSDCAIGCSYCVRNGTDSSCTRAALFAAP
jgi:hypothetical protein